MLSTNPSYYFSYFKLLLIFLVCQSCDGDSKENLNTCSCPIERPTTKESGRSIDTINDGYSLDGGVGVTIPRIKKLLEANSKLAGNYHNEKVQVEETYWEILNENPEITQYAHLFWTIACAMYEIACEDPTIDERQRALEKRKIVSVYSAKLEEIIKNSPSAIKNESRNNSGSAARTRTQKPSIPSDDETSNITAKKEESKYIRLQLIVDAIFSNAEFFINGTPVFPLATSTLTVKEFEVEFKSVNIVIVAKSETHKCEKDISIPSDFFDRPKTLQLVCSEWK